MRPGVDDQPPGTEASHKLGERRLVLLDRARRPDEENAVEVGAIASQPPLDVRGRLFPDPEHITRGQRYPQEGSPSSDRGNRGAQKGRLSDFLASVKEGHSSHVGDQRSDDWRSFDWCGLHLRITESYQAGRQSLAHPTRRFARGWRMNNRSLVDVHGRYRVRRSVPPRGGVALPASLPSAIRRTPEAFADVVGAAIVQTPPESFSSMEA